MRFHLLTVEGTQQSGEEWRIAPLVPLRNLAPHMMMPMAGDEVELRLPGGDVLAARIAGFGIDVWKDDEGNFWATSDLSDPSLTLTIICSPDVAEVPAGTEIWLPNAKLDSAAEGS